MPVAAPLDPSWTYRRAARRLRSVYAGNPVLLQRSLRTLSDQHDAGAFGDARSVKGHPDDIAPPRRSAARMGSGVGINRVTVNRRVEVPLERNARTRCPEPTSFVGATADDATRAAGDRFAGLVRGMLEEGILRYSRRQALLRQAERLGVSRFEANLIIAAVQYQHDGVADRIGHYSASRSKLTISGVLAVVALVQGLIVSGAWWLITA